MSEEQAAPPKGEAPAPRKPPAPEKPAPEKPAPEPAAPEPAEEPAQEPSEQPAASLSTSRKLTLISLGGFAAALLAILANAAQFGDYVEDHFLARPSPTATAPPPATATAPPPVAQPPVASTPSASAPAPTVPAASAAPPMVNATAVAPGPQPSPTTRVVTRRAAPTTRPPATTKAVVVSVPFRFETPQQAPMCSDFTGTGSRPANGQVLIFVQHANQDEYFYEQPVEFGDDRWVSRKVRLGDPGDDGQFYLHAQLLDNTSAEAIKKCVGVVCKYPKAPPGSPIARSGPVTRTASLGSCSS